MSEVKKLEDNFKDIEDIIEKLNENDVTLDEAFAKYKAGLDLVKLCSEQLDGIESAIRVLSEEGVDEGETIEE